MPPLRSILRVILAIGGCQPHPPSFMSAKTARPAITAVRSARPPSAPKVDPGGQLTTYGYGRYGRRSHKCESACRGG
jgi:hypothetical protein